MLGIRIVPVGERRLGVVRASLRFVVMMLALIPLGAGFVTVLFDDRRRGPHDMVWRHGRAVGDPASVLAAEVAGRPIPADPADDRVALDGRGELPVSTRPISHPAPAPLDVRLAPKALGRAEAADGRRRLAGRCLPRRAKSAGRAARMAINLERQYAFEGAVAQLGERAAGSRKVRGSSPLSSIP